MIKRGKDKGKACIYMLFAITVYKGNTYLITKTPTKITTEFVTRHKCVV